MKTLATLFVGLLYIGCAVVSAYIASCIYDVLGFNVFVLVFGVLALGYTTMSLGCRSL